MYDLPETSIKNSVFEGYVPVEETTVSQAQGFQVS